MLLDELGAATDPEEGGALGVAIVEHFRAAGAFTLVSTHLMALKIYGASTEGVVNGSMGFDEETLRARPTACSLGLPGKSAGLEIATRLGMPEDIMQRARRSMSDRERDVTRFLAELHRRIEETQALEQSLREKLARAGAARKGTGARVGEARIRQAEGAGAPHRPGAGALRGAGAGDHRQNRAERATGARPSRRPQRRVAKAKRELREDFQTTVLSTAGRIAPGAASSRRASKRARASACKDVREPARVRRLLGNGRIEVEAGFMKMQVSIDDVIEVLPEAAAAGGKLPKNVSYRPAPGAGAGAPGDQRDRPARRRSARRRGRIPGPRRDGHRQPRPHRARPRHGHPEEDRSPSCSASHPHVARFYPAPQQEGGAGATIVELRE